jgi:mannose-1-phosphate guanylyltransferase
MWKSGFLWNSGIFAWRVTDFLSEIDAHTPEIAPALRAHGDDAAEYFRAVQPIAVDHGVLERSNRVLVVDGDFGWDDVGTWGALARVRARDPFGNVASGDVHFVDAHRNVVHAERGDVVLYGVNDLVLVVHDGVVLVTTVDRSADLKTLVDALPPSVRERK